MVLATRSTIAATCVAGLLGCNGGGEGGNEAATGSEGATGGDTTTGATASGSVDGTAGTSGPTTGATTGVDDTATDEGSAGSETGEPPIVCEANCHYVRADASGDGSDWANALPALPDALERGHVYFVAAGSYPAYTFDDAEAGTDTIRVVRAATVDHGTDSGWDPGYAEGEATFGPLVFASAYVHFDGRGATRIVGSFESTVVDIAASDVLLRACDVDGAFQLTNDMHTDGACTGMNVSGDRVVVEGNVIHDAADDGMVVSASTEVSIVGNVVHALHGCGTDGGCGPCYNGHSDGLEIYDLADSEIVGNMIYDVASTAALFFGNWADELGNGPDEYCENILLANNLLYSPDTGFVAYIEDARGVQVINNVLWGLRQGAYGGLSIGTNVQDLDVYNNAIVSINYAHIGGTYDPVEHRGDYNLFAASLGQWQDGSNDVVSIDAGFVGIPDADGAAIADPTPQDFAPVMGGPLVDAGFGGDADIVVPPADFFGEPRDRTPNIGAIE